MSSPAVDERKNLLCILVKSVLLHRTWKHNYRYSLLIMKKGLDD